MTDKPDKAKTNAGIANLRPAKKGEVRNPEGRNQFTDGRKRVMTLAQQVSDKALNVLIKQLNSKDEAISQRAALALLERGVGKPVQPVADVDADGNDRPEPPPMIVVPVQVNV